MRGRALTHDAARQAVARPAEEDLLLLDYLLGRHLFLLGRRVGADGREGDAEFSRTRRVKRRSGIKGADSACCWARKGGYQRREGKGEKVGGGRFVVRGPRDDFAAVSGWPCGWWWAEQRIACRNSSRNSAAVCR
jgi:hypothetical protein